MLRKIVFSLLFGPFWLVLLATAAVVMFPIVGLHLWLTAGRRHPFRYAWGMTTMDVWDWFFEGLNAKPPRHPYYGNY